MPVRQMKLRFDARPTTRVVPSRSVPAQLQGKGEKGNQKTSGTGRPSAGPRGAGMAAGESTPARPPDLTFPRER
jgi:hypothetical protein